MGAVAIGLVLGFRLQPGTNPKKAASAGPYPIELPSDFIIVSFDDVYQTFLVPGEFEKAVYSDEH